MYQDQRVNEARLERTRRMGIPDGAGSSMLMEGDGTGAHHHAIRQRFGHVLSGGLRDKLDDMDSHSSSLFMAPSRINTHDEFGNGGRGAAALSTRQHFPSNDRRNMRARGPQTTKVSKPEFSVGLDTFDTPVLGDEISQLAQVEQMFNGGASSRSSYAPAGPLLPERGLNTSMDLGGYGAGIPFDPINQIRNKVASRSRANGVDYRELEGSISEVDEVENRYLNNMAHRNRTQDSSDAAIHEMSKIISEQHQTIRSLMNEKNGKQYFKEVKTTHRFENPKSKLVEIDGKYYRMELTQVKFKKGKSSDK